MNIIKKPLFTEKSVQDAKNGKFSFVVDIAASKGAIAQAVQKQFDVKVVDVATSILKGKTKRVGKRRTEITVSKIKKAIVQLKEGQKINLFDIQE